MKYLRNILEEFDCVSYIMRFVRLEIRVHSKL